jgi:hypothetical protein
MTAIFTLATLIASLTVAVIGGMVTAYLASKRLREVIGFEPYPSEYSPPRESHVVLGTIVATVGIAGVAVAMKSLYFLAAYHPSTLVAFGTWYIVGLELRIALHVLRRDISWTNRDVEWVELLPSLWWALLGLLVTVQIYRELREV